MKKSTFLLSVATLTCIGAGAVASSGTAWFNSSTESIGTLDAEDGDVTVTPDEPVTIEPGTDCTHFLTNPDFSNPDGEGWTWEVSGASRNKSGGLSTFPSAEVWTGQAGATFDVYQTVSGLPDGVYSLTVNAFCRLGYDYTGSEQVSAYVYINEINSPVLDIMNGARESIDGIPEYTGYDWLELDGIYVPYSMSSASYLFSNGEYEQTVRAFVQNGEMRIGIKSLTPSMENGIWCIWSNFRLVYEGQTSDALNIAIENTLKEMDAFVGSNELNEYGMEQYKVVQDILSLALDTEDVDEKSALLRDASERFKNLQYLSSCIRDYYSAMAKLDMAISNNENPSSETIEEYEQLISEDISSMDENSLVDLIARINVATTHARIPDYSNASDDNPVDMTTAIVNNSFETGDLTGWTYYSGVDTRVVANVNSTYTIENAEGGYIFNTYDYVAPFGGFYVSQIISGLPAGTYRFTALAASDMGNRVTLSAKPQTELGIAYANTVTMINDKSVGTDISKLFIVNEGEDIEIKLSSNNWFKADNFRLEYYGSNSQKDPSNDENVSDEDFFIETLEGWTSENRGQQNSVSSKIWKIYSAGKDRIAVDYSVSSEYGGDFLTINIVSPSGVETQLVRVSGSQGSSVMQSLSEVGEYTLEALYTKNYDWDSDSDEGKVTSIRHLQANPVDRAKMYLATIETDYPALAAELSAAITAAETAEEDQKTEAWAQLGAVMSQVRKAVEIYPSLAALLEQAKALAETLPEENANLTAAISAADAIDLATSASADYVTAYETLKYQFALVNAAYVPMDEWAFNTNIEYTVDGLKYYIDTDHNIARFNGLDYTMGQSELILPEMITIGGNPYFVVAMEHRYSYSQPNIKSVVLPNTLRRIGSYALRYFSSLKSLEIPAIVESVGTGAFDNSDSLQTITMKPMTPPVCDGNIGGNSQKRLNVPDGSFHAYRIASQWSGCAIVPETPVELTVNVVDAGELGRIVLDEAGYLQEVNKLTVTGELNNDDWASIKNMTNLISIDMSGVLNTSVPDYQFDGKWALEEAVISNKCTYIGREAFSETGLKEVIIPEGVETVGDEAFSRCKKVTSVEMPNSVIAVGSYAFYGCNALKNVKLSESMSEISSNMLTYTAIEEIDIPASVTIINRYAFNGCASLTSLVCPSSLKVIEEYAFCDCSSLKDIEFNEGLISIEYYSFCNCKALTEMTLPSSLTRCAGASFIGCSNLKKMYARSIIPATTEGSCPLSNVPLNDVVLYVPSWSVQEYQLADGWAQFMTVETHDFLPQNVCINKDFTFALLDELAEDYRPNISLQWSEVQSKDSYGNTNYETGNLTINSRSKLPVNDFTLYVSPYKKWFDDYKVVYGQERWSSSKMYASTSLIVNGEMRAENVTLNLLARRNKWQFVCFPFDVQMSDIVPVDPVTQWVIREYSAENRANNKLDETWLNVPSDATLKSGKGYILHCYNPNVSDDLVQFTVSPLRESVNRQAIFIADDRNVALEENISEFEQNRSWNLIGNPYPSYFDSRFLDFDAPITVWNTCDNNYHAYSPVDDAYILSPGEAFFVQRPVDQESIVFEKAGRQTHTYARIIEDEPSAAAARRMAAPARGHRHVINLHLNGENASDHTRVVINEAASMDYELSRDASKFMSLDADVPQLYSLCNGVRYAINERPLSDGEVVLGVSVGKAGVYTISISENDENEYIIEDRLMNTSAALSADQPFEFTAEPGDMEGRFILRSLTPGGATSVDSIAEGAAEAGAPAFNTAGQTVNQKVADGIVVKKNRKVIQ